MIDRNTNVQITDEALAFAKPMLVAGRVKKRETYSQNINVKYRCYKCDGKGCYKCK